MKVRAVQYGRVLVVDEADKAPIHVTAILRNIVGGESITLADGRKIVPAACESTCAWSAVLISYLYTALQTGSYSHIPTDRLIPIHPDFRMIVLANRPGFPFLGNNFFAALGINTLPGSIMIVIAVFVQVTVLAAMLWITLT